MWQIFAQDLRFLIGFIMPVWEETEAELRWWSLTGAPQNSTWDNFEHASEEFVFGVSLSEHTGLKSLQPTVCFLSHPEVWLGLASPLQFLAVTVKHSTHSRGEWDFLGVIHVILSFISPWLLYFLNTLLIPSDSLHFPYFPSFFACSGSVSHVPGLSLLFKFFQPQSFFMGLVQSMRKNFLTNGNKVIV